ncbi:hypothetical protein BDZ91DRAFT_792828 [Kalaharituber pfeilii]|nr:hypothetical protein BDZ91DRAFT_792828 [Kalaharituber pfeilii]
MEDPAKEVPAILHGLTSSSISHQSHVIYKYFLPNASFQHPLAYVPSFALERRQHGNSGPASCWTKAKVDSRLLMKGIYRWYRMLSPSINLRVHSVAWDKTPRDGTEKQSVLYVDCTQTMGFWFLPPGYRKSTVSLVVAFNLEQRLATVYEDGEVQEQEEEEVEEVVEEEINGKIRKVNFVDDVGYVGGKLEEEVEGHQRAGTKRENRWFIAKRRDLYPLEDLAKFALLMPGLS